MLYYLYYYRFLFSPLNVFQYITFRTGGAIVTSFLLTVFGGIVLLKELRQYRISQVVRPDGPPTHLAKSGTPTMGGILILWSLIMTTVLWARLDNRFVIATLIGTGWLGFWGFMDDYQKLIKNNPAGLLATVKIIAQLILGLALGIYLWLYPANPQYAGRINIPYLKECYLNLGSFYILLVVLVIVGSSNAVNLTDGLDGLAIGNLIIAGATYAIFVYLAGHARFSQYLRIIPVPGVGELTIFLAAMVGAGLGFLWYNSHPAEVFMGDTGSLFLGGSLGMIALFVRQELLLIIIGGIFVIEALSVLLQVYSFRHYKRRIFRMAPLHHHFELQGLAEPKVVVRFWIVGIILALLALGSLKLR